MSRARVVAMIVMIVTVDQLVWRPALAWAQKFKVEETAAAEAPRSLVLDLLRRSRVLGWLRRQTGRLSGQTLRPDALRRTADVEGTRRRDDRHDRHGRPAGVAPRARVGAEVQGRGDRSGGSAALARARSAPPLASPRLAPSSDGTALRANSPTGRAAKNGGCRGHASTR